MEGWGGYETARLGVWLFCDFFELFQEALVLFHAEPPEVGAGYIEVDDFADFRW